jgi:hypothetical protein
MVFFKMENEGTVKDTQGAADPNPPTPMESLFWVRPLLPSSFPGQGRILIRPSMRCAGILHYQLRFLRFNRLPTLQFYRSLENQRPFAVQSSFPA